MDKDTWRFINTFAPWFSALGTFAAVVTSLFLARRSNRVTLEVRAGRRKVAFISRQPPPVAEPPDLVWISITNIGRRDATITHIYWRTVPWRKSGIVLLPPSNEYSSEFPVTLKDGQTANYAFPVAEFEKKWTKHFSEFAAPTGVMRLRLLRLCVGTSTGDLFRVAPEKELRQLIRKMVRSSAD